MFQAGVPREVEGAGEPDREERPLQILRFATGAGEEVQNLRRAPAGILTVLVCLRLSEEVEVIA